MKIPFRNTLFKKKLFEIITFMFHKLNLHETPSTIFELKYFHLQLNYIMMMIVFCFS